LSASVIEQLGNNCDGRLLLSPQTIITPLAADLAREKQIVLVRSERDSSRALRPANGKSIIILSQTGCQSQQQAVIDVAERIGYSAQSEKAPGRTSPAVLKAAVRDAERVARGEVQRLIVLDENVYPLSTQLKRVSGVSPKICWDRETAIGSRDHNVLLLSTRLLGIPSLRKITEAWLDS
jgi:ribose 5-phosphate isomerase RpiB